MTAPEAGFLAPRSVVLAAAGADKVVLLPCCLENSISSSLRDLHIFSGCISLGKTFSTAVAAVANWSTCDPGPANHQNMQNIHKLRQN